MSEYVSKWSELVAGQVPMLSTFRENVGVALRLAPKAITTPQLARHMLATHAAGLTAVCIVDGTDAVRATLQALRPAAEGGARSALMDAQDPVASIGLLRYLNLAECAGELAPDFGGAPVKELMKEIVKQKDSLSERERHEAAFMALGVGQPKLVAKILGEGPVKPYEPFATFSYDAIAFLRYLCAARDRKAPAAGVEPAFVDFLRVFPRKLAAESLDWPELLWVARAYFHLFEKRPVSEVATALQAMVRSL